MKVKNTCDRILVLFFLLVLFIFPFQATGNEIISPSVFDLICETSIDVAEVYRDYENYINTFQPHCMVAGDILGFARQTFLVPTNDGYKEVTMMQGNSLVYFKGQIRKDYSLGVQAVLNAFHLELNESSNYWSNDYCLLPFFIENDQYDLKLTMGALYKITPSFLVDSLNNRLFVFNPTGNLPFKENLEFLFGVRYRIFEVGSFYDFIKKNLKLLEYNMNFPIGKKNVFGAGFNYYRYSGITQAGLRYSYKPTAFASLEIESYFNIRKIGLAYVIPTGFVSLFKQKVNEQKFPAEQSITKKNNFFITLGFGGSYSRDIFQEGLYGYFMNLAFENIPGVLFTPCCLLLTHYRFPPASVVIGFSRNFHKDLYRLPLKDKFAVQVTLKLLFY